VITLTEVSGEVLDDWKSEARAVAVTGNRLVLEDGHGVSDSSDEGNKPDELGNMYAPGCSEGDPKLGV
jgi:hypothetical protein